MHNDTEKILSRVVSCYFRLRFSPLCF